MIRVHDLQNAPLSMRFYGGHDGCKEGIVANGENWIIKYPAHVARAKLDFSVSSPISEFLGSHIYRLRGMDVHEQPLLASRKRTSIEAAASSPRFIRPGARRSSESEQYPRARPTRLRKRRAGALSKLVIDRAL